MQANILLGGLEQGRQLQLGQPDCATFRPQEELCFAVVGGIQHQFAAVGQTRCVVIVVRDEGVDIVGHGWFSFTSACVAFPRLHGETIWVISPIWSLLLMPVIRNPVPSNTPPSASPARPALPSIARVRRARP